MASTGGTAGHSFVRWSQTALLYLRQSAFTEHCCVLVSSVRVQLERGERQRPEQPG